ncbi:lytic transglycosylase domain-containing protein [Flavobacterium psychrophilum]
MKIKKKTGIILAVVLVSSFLIFCKTYNKNSNIGINNNFPNEIDFAGEKTPLQIYDIKERMDRELLINENLHSSTILILKRAYKAFPIIEPILAKYGVPDDFKYLAVIESSLVNAVSVAGARGVWQFMPETAREKGLEVSETVDERYHLEKSTEAACKYLLAAKQKFGSWTLAAASYNGGMAGITKQIEFQEVNNYYDLLLNEETSRYVFRILALKEIMKNPVLHGFSINKEALCTNLLTRKIQVDTTISNLVTFAKLQGINYKILKYHNPWLRDKKLDNPTKKTYNIEIPTEGYN